MTSSHPKPYLHKVAHESLNELKALKEDCFAELLSHAPFLQVNRGEFGNVVQPSDSQAVNPSLLKATSYFFFISLSLGNLQIKNGRFDKVNRKTF